MKKRAHQDWVDTLALFDPKDAGPTSLRSKAYLGMIKAGIPFDDRVAINREAAKLYRERRRSAEKTADAVQYAEGRTYGGGPIDLRPGKVNWVDEFADPWGPTGRYGKSFFESLVEQNKDILDEAMRDLAMYGNAFIKFNTEGEKQMEKIDWHKPLRSLKPGRGENPKVYTYKSGKQRVVWIDDRVYPVDEQGRTVADVWYYQGSRLRVGAAKGAKIVENVPEEKFFLGLYRHIGTSNYFLEDGGVMKTRDQVKLVECTDQWIVDTRKAAEPPKAIVYDPKDYVVVYHGEEDETAACTGILLTQDRAKSLCGTTDTIVRVRTTPPPADTARYIQLWRVSPSGPWRINDHGPAAGGSQEFTWAETQHRGVNEYRTAIKVRD